MFRNQFSFEILIRRTVGLACKSMCVCQSIHCISHFGNMSKTSSRIHGDRKTNIQSSFCASGEKLRNIFCLKSTCEDRNYCLYYAVIIAFNTRKYESSANKMVDQDEYFRFFLTNCKFF